MFKQDLKIVFDEHGKNPSTQKAGFRYEVYFTIAYRSLDRRQFKQRYALVVFFPLRRVWAEPVGSLLEHSAGDAG
jgi:hypothetical protein